jgi:hypothetical protein
MFNILGPEDVEEMESKLPAARVFPSSENQVQGLLIDYCTQSLKLFQEILLHC